MSLTWCRIMAVHKCCTFRLKRKNLLSPTPDACCPLLALRIIQLMTGEPRPRYSALQLLVESGACGNTYSIIIGGNASARATAKPSMIKWFHLVPPEYYLTATEMENSVDYNTFCRYFDDNHYIIHTMARTNALKFVHWRRQNTLYRSCFDSANQQIIVHLWGPIVLGAHNICVQAI